MLSVRETDIFLLLELLIGRSAKLLLIDFLIDLQKNLETEKKRTDKLKEDLSKTEEDLANLKKVNCFHFS